MNKMFAVVLACLGLGMLSGCATQPAKTFDYAAFHARS